ncbi:helix-turn-helix domain-containing protein [Allobranchiibius huperziae]|uniref:Transcriptional regulator with XRE-family HTH domain n=1 Tax=Allobranchiibius huperziae TaxID=1874116 RepID=A0A853DGA9_9MICO|nr:transcriptional regulator with XRE-family HTH domain [Allobranchiibius huperziae]
MRHGHGWSQIELADRLTQALGKRFDPATLARLEKGKRSIDVGELVVLAEVLQTEPMALLGHPQRLRWRRDIDEARRESRDALRVLSESAARYFTYRGIEERLTTEAAERGEKVSGVTLWPDQPAAFEPVVDVLTAAGLPLTVAREVAAAACKPIPWESVSGVEVQVADVGFEP